MISLKEYKKALGPVADEMTEKQILDLRDQQDQMADIFFDMWLAKINKEDEL